MIIKTQGTQKESQIVNLGKVNPVLHYNIEYDTTKPEETIRDFVANIKNMLSRYSSNESRIEAIEEEMFDLEHYIEIMSFQNVPNGYKLYRKLAELRKERRACKNENYLLKPVWEHFHATDVLNKLSAVQGNVAKARELTDGRRYLVRTDVLDPFMDPKDDPEKCEIKVMEA